MKNFRIFILLLLIVSSCNDDFEEFSEIQDDIQISKKDLSTSFKSLSQINDPLLVNQLNKSKEHIKKNVDLDFLLKDHEINKLYLDTNNIIVENKLDMKSYTFYVIIPHVSKDELLNQYAYLTLNFDSLSNIENKLLFGFQMEYVLSFDSEGNISDYNSSQSKNYTSKPSNKLSKAPKSVICNYFASYGANTPTTVANYCNYFGGDNYPAPEAVLDALYQDNITHNYNDLNYPYRYWYDSSKTIYNISFSSFGTLAFQNMTPTVADEMITFYQKVHYPGFGYFSSTSNKTQIHHLNKQVFISSFQNWLYNVSDYAPNTYNYLVSNPQLIDSLFDFFAEYNLKYGVDGGVYLNLPWYSWQYSQNEDIKCINSASNFLKTSAGLDLLVQYGTGIIDKEQFRDGLPLCD